MNRMARSTVCFAKGQSAKTSILTRNHARCASQGESCHTFLIRPWVRRKRLSSEKMHLNVTILKNYISQFTETEEICPFVLFLVSSVRLKANRFPKNTLSNLRRGSVSAIKGIQAMQAVSNLPINGWLLAVFPRESQKTARSQPLIGRFETACIAWIPLIAESGTDHIERAVFVTSASIFSETVGRMKLKFGEEIDKKLIYQDPSPFRWDFQYFCVNSSLKWRRSRLTAAKLQALSPSYVITRFNRHRPKLISL